MRHQSDLRKVLGDRFQYTGHLGIGGTDHRSHLSVEPFVNYAGLNSTSTRGCSTPGISTRNGAVGDDRAEMEPSSLEFVE